MSVMNGPGRWRLAAVGLLPALLLASGCSGGSTIVVPGTSNTSASTSAGSSTSSDTASSPAATAGSSSSPGTSSGAGGTLVATAGALGPARVGQPVAAFAAALGRKVEPPAAGEGDNKCWVLTLTDLPKVTVMVLDTVSGPVRRVDVFSPKIRTAEGVGVGSTRQQVLAAYPGKVKAEPHKFVPGAEYLTVSGGGHDLLFEVDEKQVVTLYRFGEPEPVSWVESCS